MAAALVMSLTLPASAAQFPDMPTGWSKDAMQAAVDAGLFEGTEDGRINPTGELTRAELAKVIAKAFGATVEADLSAYTDVNGSWYTQPMALAVKMGVINGTGATSMSPTRKVTRQEAATILARALKLTDGTAEDLAAFSDADQIGSWFVGPMAAMVKAGYLNGSDGKLNPTAIMTRESLAVMMYNIFTTYIQKSGEVTEAPEGNVMISAPDVTLKGVNVTGDLIIGDGVGEGDVTIDNCTIGGGVIVRGGGVNSVHFISTTVTKTVIITKTTGAVRVVSDTESTVATSVVSASGTVTLEGTFTTVEVATSEAAVEAKNVTAETVSVTAAEAQVTMTDSTVTTVAVTAADTTVALANTTATTVTVAQAANLEMTGETKVTTMAVTSENVTVSTTGDVVITTVQTDTTVVVTGEGTVENVTGDGEVTDTPPEPDPEPSESVEPSAPVESGDPTDIGTSNTPAPHVHTLVWKFDENDDWQVCTADGCDDADLIITAAAAHTPGDDGKCTKCGYGNTVIAEGSADCTNKTNHGTTTGHTKVAGESVAPTCTKEGKDVYKCDNCTYKWSLPVTPTGHDFSTKDATTLVSAAVAPTCSTAGKMAVYHCANCDATTGGEVDPATNHSGNTSETWVKNDTYHWKVCSECNGQIEMAAHTFDEGTHLCECGLYDPSAPCEHEETSDWTPAANGKHVKTCTACGKVVETGTCNDEGTLAATTSTCKTHGHAAGTKCNLCNGNEKPGAELDLDPTNHEGTPVDGPKNKAATCTAVGWSGQKVCPSCNAETAPGQEVAKTAHSWGDPIKDEGADTYHHVCSVCQASEACAAPNPAANP